MFERVPPERIFRPRMKSDVKSVQKVFKKNLLKDYIKQPGAFLEHSSYFLQDFITMTRLRMTQLWASALQLFPWPFLWHDVA